MLPIDERKIVLAGAEVIVGLIAMDCRANGRHLICAERLMAKKCVDRCGVDHAEKLAARIGPKIFTGAAHRDRTRGDERDQFMLINR